MTIRSTRTKAVLYYTGSKYGEAFPAVAESRSGVRLNRRWIENGVRCNQRTLLLNCKMSKLLYIDVNLFTARFVSCDDDIIIAIFICSLLFITDTYQQ